MGMQTSFCDWLSLARMHAFLHTRHHASMRATQNPQHACKRSSQQDLAQRGTTCTPPCMPCQHTCEHVKACPCGVRQHMHALALSQWGFAGRGNTCTNLLCYDGGLWDAATRTIASSFTR